MLAIRRLLSRYNTEQQLYPYEPVSYGLEWVDAADAGICQVISQDEPSAIPVAFCARTRGMSACTPRVSSQKLTDVLSSHDRDQGTLQEPRRNVKRYLMRISAETKE